MTTGYLLSLSEIVEPQPAMSPLQSVQAQSAWLLQSRGLSVTSSSNAALNGVYPADNATVAILLAVQYFVDRNARFPGQGGQYIIADLGGNPHVFTAAISPGGVPPPPFTQLVYALADFAAACTAAAITGTTPLPSSSVTIA